MKANDDSPIPGAAVSGVTELSRRPQNIGHPLGRGQCQSRMVSHSQPKKEEHYEGRNSPVAVNQPMIFAPPFIGAFLALSSGRLRGRFGQYQNVLPRQGLDHRLQHESFRFELGFHLRDGHLVLGDDRDVGILGAVFQED